MEPKKQNIARTYGLIAGACLIVLTLVLYLGGVETYLGGLARLGYAILIGLAAWAAVAQKKANGGYLEFMDALKACFTVFVIGLASQTFFTWLLLNVLDTHFRDVLNPVVLQRTADAYRKLGLTDDQLAKAMDVERGKNQFTLGSMSLGLAFTCIVHFIIALLLAALIKKKKDASLDAAF